LSHLLLALGTVLMLIYWRHGAGRPQSGTGGWWRSAVKTGSVAALALWGLAQGAPGPVVAGAALGAVGDFWLSRPGTRAFLAGMAAFAAGHLAYAGFLLAHGAGAGIGPWLVAGGVAAVGLALFPPRAGALRWPVAGYILIIAAMLWAALGLPGRAWVLLAGAGLFVLSDFLLALEMFVVQGAGARRRLALALWPAYWAGQALIVAGSLALAA
jgi:uncharacterized membrane protein YhhN